MNKIEKILGATNESLISDAIDFGKWKRKGYKVQFPDISGPIKFVLFKEDEAKILANFIRYGRRTSAERSLPGCYVKETSQPEFYVDKYGCSSATILPVPGDRFLLENVRYVFYKRDARQARERIFVVK